MTKNDKLQKVTNIYIYNMLYYSYTCSWINTCMHMLAAYVLFNSKTQDIRTRAFYRSLHGWIWFLDKTGNLVFCTLGTWCLLVLKMNTLNARLTLTRTCTYNDNLSLRTLTPNPSIYVYKIVCVYGVCMYTRAVSSMLKRHPYYKLHVYCNYNKHPRFISSEHHAHNRCVT